MIIKKEITSFDEFNAWSGGADTLHRLREINQDEAVFEYLDGMFEEMDETELNDYLWFERDDISDYLGFDFFEYNSYDEAMEAKDGKR